VSPLWPDTVHVGLFPGLCWLKSKRAEKVLSIASPPVHDAKALLDTLAVMLDTEANMLRKGSKVVVTVSNSVAAIASLPWQPSLTLESELQGYARVCFEKFGVAIDDEWTIHTEFRHYGAMGLAYALPNAWLASLIDLLQARGLRLQTVLPVTAKAYAHRMLRRQAGKSLILLQETLCNSALVVDGNGLCSYDAEPVIGSSQESSVRLLKRVGAREGKIGSVISWALDLEEKEGTPDFIEDCLPGATCQVVSHNAWSR